MLCSFAVCKICEACVWWFCAPFKEICRCDHSSRRWQSRCSWFDCATYPHKTWATWSLQNLPKCFCYPINISGIFRPFQIFDDWFRQPFSHSKIITADKRHAYTYTREGHIKTWLCVLLRSPHSSGTLLIHIKPFKVSPFKPCYFNCWWLSFRLWSMVLAICHSLRNK